MCCVAWSEGGSESVSRSTTLQNEHVIPKRRRMIRTINVSTPPKTNLTEHAKHKTVEIYQSCHDSQSSSRDQSIMARLIECRNDQSCHDDSHDAVKICIRHSTRST